MDLVHEDQQSIFEVCRTVGKINNVPEPNTYWKLVIALQHHMGVKRDTESGSWS